MVDVLDELVMLSHKLLVGCKALCRFGIFMHLREMDVF